MVVYQILMVLLMATLTGLVANTSYRTHVRESSPLNTACAGEYWRGVHDGFAEGFEMAKEVYKPMQVPESDLGNDYTTPLTSEILMAYGVSSVSMLPKEVREAYNLEDSGQTFDDIYKAEVEDGI